MAIENNDLKVFKLLLKTQKFDVNEIFILESNLYIKFIIDNLMELKYIYWINKIPDKIVLMIFKKLF